MTEPKKPRKKRTRKSTKKKKNIVDTKTQDLLAKNSKAAHEKRLKRKKDVVIESLQKLEKDDRLEALNAFCPKCGKLVKKCVCNKTGKKQETSEESTLK